LRFSAAKVSALKLRAAVLTMRLRAEVGLHTGCNSVRKARVKTQNQAGLAIQISAGEGGAARPQLDFAGAVSGPSQAP